MENKTIPIMGFKGNNNKNVEIGRFNPEDRFYYTNRTSNDLKEHFFRIFEGFAVSDEKIIELQKLGAKGIRIYHIKENEIRCLESNLQQWLESTNHYINKIINTEIKDSQTALEEIYMRDITESKQQKGGIIRKMAEDIFSKGIGNKESSKSLDAKPVVVQGKVAEPVLGKAGSKNAGKEVGKKLTLICKHPDREESIKISTMVFISGKSVKSSTMWINLDEDGNIQKGSTVATLLTKYNLSNINAIEGKTLDTELDENKFLAIKVY